VPTDSHFLPPARIARRALALHQVGDVKLVLKVIYGAGRARCGCLAGRAEDCGSEQHLAACGAYRVFFIHCQCLFRF
jgi:hypothetical protein